MPPLFISSLCVPCSIILPSFITSILSHSIILFILDAIIILVVSVLVIAVTLYVRTFYLNYQSNKINESVFADKSIKAINIEDFDYAIKESSNVILYVGTSGSKEIYNMEKRLYKEIIKKGLSDNIIYLNISNSEDPTNYINELRNKFPNIKDEINSIPMLIYVNDGVAVEAMGSELKLIDYKVFNKLISKYEIE